MADSMHGSNGHENTMFFLYFKILNSWFPSWIRTMWMRYRMWSAVCLLLLAHKSSTLWIRFWNMKRAVQCARRNEWFMQLLFVMELASLWVLYWPTPCFSVIVMQQQLCPIFCKSQGFGNQCLWLNTALCWRPCFTSSIAFELLLDDEKHQSLEEWMKMKACCFANFSDLNWNIARFASEGWKVQVDLWNLKFPMHSFELLLWWWLRYSGQVFVWCVNFFSDMQGVTKNEQNHQHILWLKSSHSFEILPGTIDSDVSLTCRQALQCSIFEGVSCCKMSQCCSWVVFLNKRVAPWWVNDPYKSFCSSLQHFTIQFLFWSHVEWQSLCFIQ